MKCFNKMEFRTRECVKYKVKCACIFFVQEGSLLLSYGAYYNEKVDAHRMFFLPANCEASFVAPDGAQVLVFYVHSIDYLNAKCQLSSIHLKHQIDHFDTLPIRDRLFLFLDILSDVLEDKLFSCDSFMNIKMEELLIYMNADYSPQELARMFSPILSNDPSFSSLVLSCMPYVSSVEDLAKMCNYSVSGFTKHFNKAYNIPPYRWIKKQKQNSILAELKYTNKSFVDISESHGFSSISYFTTFCSREFGFPPKELRNRIHNKTGTDVQLFSHQMLTGS